MSNNMIHGNEVIYIEVYSKDLDTVPIIDGQIIAFIDKTGFFYDMGDVRHQVVGAEVVNRLPSVGVSCLLYVLLKATEQYESGLYIYDGSKYVPVIDSPAIESDAPADNFRYTRRNNEWITDEYTFYAEKDEDNICNLIDFIHSADISGGKYIRIIGDFEYLGTKLVVDTISSLDFTQANFNNYELQYSNEFGITIQDKDSYHIDLSMNSVDSNNNSKLVGLNAKYVLIQSNESIYISDCSLFNSRVIIDELHTDVRIDRCKFYTTETEYTSIILVDSNSILDEVSSVNISNCTFSHNIKQSEEYIPCCAILILTSEFNTYSYLKINENKFIGCYVASTTIDMDTFSTVQMMSTSDYISEEVCSTVEFMDVRNSNDFDLRTLLLDIYFVKWASLNYSNICIFNLGDVFAVPVIGIELGSPADAYLIKLETETGSQKTKKLLYGIADFNVSNIYNNDSEKKPNILLEVGPNYKRIHFDILEAINHVDDSKILHSYLRDIVRHYVDREGHITSCVVDVAVMTAFEKYSIDDIEEESMDDVILYSEYLIPHQLKIYNEGLHYQECNVPNLGETSYDLFFSNESYIEMSLGKSPEVDIMQYNRISLTDYPRSFESIQSDASGNTESVRLFVVI